MSNGKAGQPIKARAWLFAGLGTAVLALAGFPAGTGTATYLAALLLTGLGLWLGLERAPRASQVPEGPRDLGIAVMAALAPLLPGLPRLWGEPPAPLLVPFALALLSAERAGAVRRQEPSPLPWSLRLWGSAFLILVAASAISSMIRGETLFLLLWGRAEPRAQNALGMTAGARSRDSLLLALGLCAGALAVDAFARFASRPSGARRLVLAGASGGALAILVATLEPWLLRGPWLPTIAASRRAVPLAGYWELVHRFSGSATDPNAMGIALGALAPLVALAAARQFRSAAKPRGLRLASLALFLAALAAFSLALDRSGSRSGLVLLLVAFAALAASAFWRAGRRVRLAIGAAAVLGIAALGFLLARAPRGGEVSVGGLVTRLGAGFSATSFQHFTSQRPVFWKTALEMVREEPLSGVGLGGFPFEFPVYYTRRHGPVEFTDNATNALLDLAAECGLPGLFAAFVVGSLIAVRALRTLLRRDRTVETTSHARVGAALVLGFAAASASGPHYRFFEITLLGALSVGLAFGTQTRPEDKPAPARRVAPAALALPLGVAALGIAASLFAAIRTLRPESAFRLGSWTGIYGVERGPSGVSERWLGKRAYRLVNPAAGESRITVDLRNDRSDMRPVLMSVALPGRPVGVVTLPPGVPCRFAVTGLSGRATAVRFSFEPTFVPARHGGTDIRELSVRLLGVLP